MPRSQAQNSSVCCLRGGVPCLGCWHSRRTLPSSRMRQGVDRHASIAQVGKGAGMLHAVLVQGAAAVLPCSHHCLRSAHTSH